MKIRLQHPEAGDRLVAIGPQPTVLGRDKDLADVVLDWDIKVSRRHARVWVADDTAWFEDLQSTNGSWAGTRRVENPIPLGPDTRVHLGDTVLALAPVAVSDAHSDTVQLEGMTIRMTADARFEGVGALLAQEAGERVAGFLEALHDIAGALLHSVTPEAVGQALRTIFRVVPTAQRIVLVEWPPLPGGEFRTLAAESALPSDSAPRVGISRGLAEHAASHRQAVFFHHEDARSQLSATPSIILHGIRSAIYVPLLEGSQGVVAMLCVDTRFLPSPFRPEEFQFIRAVADLLAAALTADQMRQEAQRREMEGREWKARRDSMAAFLKIASHDLKNPLAVVEMAAYTLKTRHDDALREVLTDQLIDASRRARVLINSYLEVCAVEKGQSLRIDVTQVDARDVVEQEYAFLRSVLSRRRQQSLALENHVDATPIRADLEKFRQICSNLISNACKYSPEGGTIEVSSRLEGDDVIFTVSDQGVGISEEDQQKLFEQFRRVGDPSIAPGTGLGLWMTRALIEAHGGRIWVMSQPGRGSVFHFSLPRPGEPDADPSESGAPSEADPPPGDPVG